MGFSLTIQEGKDQGRQYSFDQPEVSIGRTAENDVVLYDPGVSRKHAVIREDGGRLVVQDMGSANGTQVNGNPITEEELQAGDMVSVGPVVFSVEVEAANSTRIVDSAELESQKAKKALAKSNSAQLRSTAPISAAQKRPTSLVPRVSKPGPPPSRSRPKVQAQAPMLASERARLRRQNAGPFGKLKIWYIEAPPKVQKAVLGGAIALGLALFGFAVYKLVQPSNRGGPILSDMSKKPFPISESASQDVFGLGEEWNVTVQTKDEAHFEFEYAESVPVVYYLKFEAFGIERKEELEISLNGVHVAYANAGMGDYTKAQRFKLPKKYLKAGIPNEIVFDNTLNPPQAEPWAISKVKLIIKPLPVGTPQELLREAKKLYDLADQRLQQKDIAAQNRFEAWSALHRSLLYMEAVDPKPDLFSLAQQTLRDVDRDLENICNKIMLTAKRSEELNDFPKAIKVLKDGAVWFPATDDDHPCRARLQEKLEEYGDSGLR